VETIMFKVPEGTKAKLRGLNRNVSALLRDQVDRLLEAKHTGSAHEKASHVCGIIKGGPSNVATSRDYLKQYAPSGHR
jgi:hypothetical protein